MDTNQKLKLKEQYSNLSDEELANMISTGKLEFEEEAFELLSAEAEKRGLKDKEENSPDSTEPVKKAGAIDDKDKPDEYVPIVIINNYDDKACLEDLLSGKEVPHLSEQLNINGYALPVSLCVSSLKVEEAVDLLKDFKPKESFLLWVRK